MTHLNCEKFTIWFDTSQPIYAIKTKQPKKLKFREMKSSKFCMVVRMALGWR